MYNYLYFKQMYICIYTFEEWDPQIPLCTHSNMKIKISMLTHTCTISPLCVYLLTNMICHFLYIYLVTHTLCQIVYFYLSGCAAVNLMYAPPIYCKKCAFILTANLDCRADDMQHSIVHMLRWFTVLNLLSVSRPIWNVPLNLQLLPFFEDSTQACL